MLVCSISKWINYWSNLMLISFDLLSDYLLLKWSDSPLSWYDTSDLEDLWVLLCMMHSNISKSTCTVQQHSYILYTLIHYFLPYDIVRPNKLDYVQPCLSEDLPGLCQSSAMMDLFWRSEIYNTELMTWL